MRVLKCLDVHDYWLLQQFDGNESDKLSTFVCNLIVYLLLDNYKIYFPDKYLNVVCINAVGGTQSKSNARYPISTLISEQKWEKERRRRKNRNNNLLTINHAKLYYNRNHLDLQNRSKKKPNHYHLSIID